MVHGEDRCARAAEAVAHDVRPIDSQSVERLVDPLGLRIEGRQRYGLRRKSGIAEWVHRVDSAFTDPIRQILDPHRRAGAAPRQQHYRGARLGAFPLEHPD